MATDKKIPNLIINEMTYQQAVDNLGSIGENELIYTTDKVLPVPTTAQNNKIVGVVDGEFAFVDNKDKSPITSLDVTETVTNVTYDTTDGAKTSGTGRIVYEDSTEEEFTTKYVLPVIGKTGVSIDASDTNDKLIIKGVIECVEITSPATATTGTFTDAEFAKLQESDIVAIKFNNEIYRLQSNGHTDGFITYSMNEYENGKFTLKSITITISTKAWILKTKDVESGGGSGVVILEIAESAESVTDEQLAILNNNEFVVIKMPSSPDIAYFTKQSTVDNEMYLFTKDSTITERTLTKVALKINKVSKVILKEVYSLDNIPNRVKSLEDNSATKQDLQQGLATKETIGVCYTKQESDNLLAQKSKVTVSASGTSTTNLPAYMTIDGSEYIVPQGGTSAVESVNGKVGVVVLSGEDIPLSSTETTPLNTAISQKSKVELSNTGTSTSEANYITLNDVQYKVGDFESTDVEIEERE